MSDFLNAANDARRLLAGFKGIEQLAAAFEKVGTVEQAGVEAQARLLKLRAQVERADGERASVVADAEKVKAAATAALQRAEEAARERLAEADRKAEAVVKAANEQAVDIVEAAEAQRAAAEDAVGVADASAKALRAEVKELEVRVDKAKAYIAKLKE